jgi:hypothetical protein
MQRLEEKSFVPAGVVSQSDAVRATPGSLGEGILLQNEISRS